MHYLAVQYYFLKILEDQISIQSTTDIILHKTIDMLMQKTGQTIQVCQYP